METKVRRTVQVRDGVESIRFETSIPKHLADIMHLEGKMLRWDYIPSKNKVELTVISNGHGKESDGRT